METDKRAILDKIFKYIVSVLVNDINDEVFTKSSLEELGKYYYDKALLEVNDATETLLQDALQALAPNFIKLEAKEDYYKTCCQIIGIECLPCNKLTHLRNEYNDVFVQTYNTVMQKADSEIVRINSQLYNIRGSIESIKNSPPSYSFMRDLSNDEILLYENYNECNALRTRKEMVEFAKQYMTSKLMDFCNIHDINSIDIALKEEALRLSENTTCGEVSTFSYYKDIIEIVEGDIDKPYAVFFKVKFYTAYEKIHRKLSMSSYTQSEEVRIEQYNADVSNIPQIDDLNFQKENDQEAYLASLKKFISDYLIIKDIGSMIEESICLRDRKAILLKCIELYNAGEFELFDNIAPVQIEGMFADYLRDTTTFRRFSKLDIYENAVLRDKIKYLQEVGSGIYPEAVEYFMYYFNNIIRNKIAHGSYKSIFKDKAQAEIFAMEVILDMGMLVYMLSRKSETEKMYRFIHGYQDYYAKLIRSKKNSCFGALLNDMTGNKIVSNYDSIEKYQPIQVAYWLVNPYYEKIYETVSDKADLLKLREEFLSKEYWIFVLDELNKVIEAGYDYKNINMEFIAIVKGLFRCNVTKEVKGVLGQVHAALHKIKNL